MPTLRPDELPHDVVLLIGDIGLAASPGRREVIDLGRAWCEWQRLPFVFAVWLLRPGVDAGRILPVLRAARDEGRRHGAVDGTRDAAHYELDEQDRAGLQRFWAECRAHGLAEEEDPRFVSDW